MHMIMKYGKPPLDLDEVRFRDDFTCARSLKQPELFARLHMLGVPNIRPDMGVDTLCEHFGFWQREGTPNAPA
jgi:hypothetical protein